MTDTGGMSPGTPVAGHPPSAQTTVAEDDDFAAVQAVIASAESEVDAAKDNLAASLARLQAADRSLIAKLVVWLFLLSCFGTLAFVVVAVWGGYGGDRWDAASARLIQLLSSVILPVVTLVIGYYFGSEQNRTGGR